MALNWKPNISDASGHRRTLLALLHAGISRQLDPRRLCEIGAGIVRFSPYDFQQALDLSDALIEYAPENASVWYFRSQALRLSQATDEAMQACDRALAFETDHAESLMMKGKLLLQAGDLENADFHLRRLEQSAPGLAAAALCECLLRQRRVSEAGELITRQTKGHSGSTALLALDCVRSILDGDTRRLATLHDPDLISTCHCANERDAPPIEAINRDLVACIGSNSAMADDPASTTTVKGAQAFLNELLPTQLLSELTAVIKSRVEAYVVERTGHPYLDNLPETLNLTSWAVSLDRYGFQDSHCHPDGVLSGVLYVDVARDHGDVHGSAGNIEFWQPPQELAGDVDVDTCSVRPENGLILIFPSYFYHRTIPHGGRDGRISIAFDVG